MHNSQEVRNWHILADRFVWSDEAALALISEEVTEEEIQKYLYTYHGDILSLEEIKQWREKPQERH